MSLLATEPAFSVLDVAPVAHAAAPTLEFAMHVSDPAGRDIHTIALSTQVRIDPARRKYDAETRARLVELFGAPDRWAATTHPFQWAHVDVLVPGFTGATSFKLQLPCSFDLELAAVKYFYSLRGRRDPAVLPLHGDGAVRRRARPAAGRAGAVELHDAVADAGGEVARGDPRVLPRRRLGAAEHADARRAAGAQGDQRGDHDFDTTVAGLLA